MRTFIAIIFIPCSLFLSAQQKEDDYVNENVLRYDDYVYQPFVKTVQFHESQWDYSAPVISLRGGEKLELSFDDIDADRKQYACTFIHCNADWTPSSLMQGEYLAGYYDLNLLNYTFSMNTLQKYVHYDFIFPQQGMSFTKSGNYLLLVYLNGDRNNLAFTRRFMVYDEKVQMSATVRQSVGQDHYNKQQLDFNISAQNYDMTNPNRDMHVVLMQNNRWDNAVTDIKPTFINGNQLVFSLDDKSAFNGGNEFRYFDCRSLRFLTERVKDIYRDQDFKNHVVLQPDELRATKPYLFYNDLNGAFQIRNTERAQNMDIEADYVYVDFFLPYRNPVSEGNFYVMGKLSDWRMNRNSKMKYNYDRNGYEVQLYLKQGYYNYIYVLSSDEKKGGDEAVTEGSHWDTENDYYILVYHRKFGTYHDQLIGYRKLNTLRK